MSKEPGTPVTLSAEQLQGMIAAAVSAAVAEAKKPLPPTEEEIRKQQQIRLDREEQGHAVLAQIQAKKFEQSTCTHQHSTGQSHCVYILDDNYILCQKCQGKIRPFVDKAAQKDKQAIYDTAQFNRLFQGLSTTDM